MHIFACAVLAVVVEAESRWTKYFRERAYSRMSRKYDDIHCLAESEYASKLKEKLKAAELAYLRDFPDAPQKSREELWRDFEADFERTGSCLGKLISMISSYLVNSAQLAIAITAAFVVLTIGGLVLLL